MTPGEYADKLRSQLDDLKRNNRPFQLAVYGTVAESCNRIFYSGVTASGSQYQYNDTTPLYVSEARQKAVLTHKGKTGKSKFKDGKEHKTTYFKSYRELREKQGLEAGFVNWTYYGDLKSDYTNSPPQSNTAVPIKINLNWYESRLNRPANLEKYTHLSKRYGDFLNVSPQEETKFYDVLEKQLRAIFEA